MEGKTCGKISVKKIKFLFTFSLPFPSPLSQIMAKGGIVRTGSHVLPVEQGNSEYFCNSTFLPHSDTFTLQKYHEWFQIKTGNFHLTQ